MKLLFAAVAAVVLFSAAPARAGEECAMHKKAAAAEKTGAVAEADKKDAKGCACDHAASKECKCGEKCKCPECPVHGKKAAKDEKKSS